MSGNSLLAAALEYAARGWAVFPVWWPVNVRCACGNSNCPSPAKHPIGFLAPHGVKNATTDPESIKRWWKAYPRGNVAIANGPESGLVILDIDPRNDGDPARLPDPLPTTHTTRTGGEGWHYYCTHPGDGFKFL